MTVDSAFGEWRELATAGSAGVVGSAEGTPGWAHCGVEIDGLGGILTADADRPELVRLEIDGRITGRVPVPVTEPHDLVVDGDGIWIADCGTKAVRTATGVYEDRSPHSPVRGQVLRVSWSGEVLDRLTPPPSAADGAYSPTSVAIDSRSAGGDGSVWVADGYGRSLVHQYDAARSFVRTLDGTEGPGRFDTPHALLIDRRRTPARLLVSDRGNGRICAYTPSGQYLGAIGAGVVLRPCGMATRGDELFVADLDGCVWLFGPDDEPRDRIGNPTAHHAAGWPNRVHPDGSHEAPARTPWSFTSPHDIAVRCDGVIVVCEWVIGGRLVRISPEPGNR